ncbi:MAG: c-type cytochrome [Candidatus Brocadiae bacterium]|nr:c-type cytochrome [Candidatus Brocadiia bacterium]
MNAKLGIIGGAVAVIAVVVAVVIFSRKGDDNGRQKDASVLVELRGGQDDPSSIVSATRGLEMYESNCVACHGWQGEGNGPADPYLWRRPRNLKDAGYMNVRTDEQLRLVINNGGREEPLQLSRIMPSWSVTFNAFQQQDIIAWVKRLHPRIEDLMPGGDFARFEAVLTPERAAQVKAKAGSDLLPGEELSVFYAVYSDRKDRPRRPDEAAPAPGAPGLAGYVAFGRVEIAAGRTVGVSIAIDPGRKIHKAAVFEKVTLLSGDKRDETSVDAYVKAFEGAGESITAVSPPVPGGREALFTALGGAVKRLYWRLILGLEQDREDWADIAAGKNPLKDHLGYAVYTKLSCAPCHGPTGRAKGPGVGAKEPLPANLADPGRMGDLTDEYLLNLLEHGGVKMNISSTMPEYGNQMTPEERKAVVDYIRALSRTK